MGRPNVELTVAYGVFPFARIYPVTVISWHRGRSLVFRFYSREWKKVDSLL